MVLYPKQDEMTKLSCVYTVKSNIDFLLVGRLLQHLLLHVQLEDVLEVTLLDVLDALDLFWLIVAPQPGYSLA